MHASIAYSTPRVFSSIDDEIVQRRPLRGELFSILLDLLPIWDAIAIVSAGVVAGFICTRSGLVQNHPLLSEELTRLSLVAALISPLILWEPWSHLALSTVAPFRLLSRVVVRMVCSAGLVLAVAFVTNAFGHVPRLWAATWFLAMVGAVAGLRFLLLAATRALASRGVVADRVAVLGWGPAADWLRATLAQARPYGVRTVNPLPAGRPGRLEPALRDLLERGRRGQLDRVVLALPETAGAQLRSVAHRLKALEIEVTSLYPAFGERCGAVRSTHVAGVPLFLITRRPHDRWGVLVKTIEDRALALLVLLCLSPLLALVALAVRLDSPGPVIFRQRRHGVNNTEFEVFKFRTMHWGADAGTGEVQTSRRDRRVTRIGAILRTTSIDELPQLFNVLNGTMSLVGPRPHPVSMRTEQLLGDEIIAEYAHRHRVKPGLTGWAQVNGCRGATETAEQLRRRVEYDIYYIENCGIM